MDLDVKMKAVILAATFLIVSNKNKMCDSENSLEVSAMLNM